MNDRLKIRVWDKYFKRYWTDEEVKNNIQWLLYPDNDNIKNVVIEQCTGLRDKNGKLIYEGDIIVISNEYPFYDCKNTDGEPVLNYIGIVKWIYNCWQYEYQCVNPKNSGISNGINNLLNEFGFDDDEFSDFEIIGNIHENPELLYDSTGADKCR